ncbi:MAG: hypothetical protein Q4D43_02190, partial [Clostridia bacterium]|nr:hypothetical protein [Clostridia bacterium]
KQHATAIRKFVRISGSRSFPSQSTKLVAVAPLQCFAGATSGTLASKGCASAAETRHAGFGALRDFGESIKKAPAKYRC